MKKRNSNTGHYLPRLRERLKDGAGRSRTRGYRIPAVWNCWGYTDVERAGRGQVAVNPYRFALECLDREILPSGLPAEPGRSLSQQAGPAAREVRGVGKAGAGRTRGRGGDWVRRATFYGMLVRATTAWDHNGDGRLRGGRWSELGTFLKSILILPLLKRMGIDTIYLLPVSRVSRLYRKGELGCPYSVKDFFALEPDLHDRLLGPEVSGVDLEFGAFVEAAHALGMRVMVDLCPRTSARDSNLILEHPDWFYWIDVREARRYGPPQVPGFAPGIPHPSKLPELFSRHEVRKHLAKFQGSPDQASPRRWRRFVRDCCKSPPRDLMRDIAKEFGVITPPGFSDVLNDPQPPWSDVTFLRLYWDHPKASAKACNGLQDQPPYVFTDTIKSSVFPGERPNEELWEVIANILPFYQRFGIDGARVDMGHALPPPLQQMIIDKARSIDPDFCFLAEEFNHGNAKAARKAGFNAIIGSGWWMEPRTREGQLHKFVHDVLPGSALPCWAAAETPDTPRAVTRRGGRAFARMIAVLNHFLPAGMPFISSGFELHERQPMNLGLDSKPQGRFSLPKNDPYYGKLAYFDPVAFHWRNSGASGMIELIGEAGEIRRRFLADVTAPRKVFMPRVVKNHERVLAIGWRVDRNRRLLVVAANLNFREALRTSLRELPLLDVEKPALERLLELKPTTGRARLTRSRSGDGDLTLRVELEPGDVKVLLIG